MMSKEERIHQADLFVGYDRVQIANPSPGATEPKIASGASRVCLRQMMVKDFTPECCVFSNASFLILSAFENCI
jgi:hypothetical protein